MSGEGTIDIALSALFEWCVPAVTGGRVEQRFPIDLIVPLTKEQEVEYAAAIEDCDAAWRVISDDGFILLAMKQPFCRAITGDGNPKVALQRFRQRLAALGGRELPAEQVREGWELISGSVEIGDNLEVHVLFTGELGNPDAGFFWSAVLARRDVHG
jgi:hypothetical protein